MLPWLFNLLLDGLVGEMNVEVLDQGLEFDGGGDFKYKLSVVFR